MDLMPEASSAPPAARRRYKWRSLTSGVLFLTFYLGSQVAARAGLPPLVVLAAGYAGFAALLWLIHEFVHLIRQLDELQQRIHVTALAMGFAGVAALLTTGGMTLTLWEFYSLRDDLAAIIATQSLPLGILAYYIALHIVKRRYE